MTLPHARLVPLASPLPPRVRYPFKICLYSPDSLVGFVDPTYDTPIATLTFLLVDQQLQCTLTCWVYVLLAFGCTQHAPPPGVCLPPSAARLAALSC